MGITGNQDISLHQRYRAINKKKGQENYIFMGCKGKNYPKDGEWNQESKDMLGCGYARY